MCRSFASPCPSLFASSSCPMARKWCACVSEMAIATRSRHFDRLSPKRFRSQSRAKVTRNHPASRGIWEKEAKTSERLRRDGRERQNHHKHVTNLGFPSKSVPVYLFRSRFVASIAQSIIRAFLGHRFWSRFFSLFLPAVVESSCLEENLSSSHDHGRSSP